MKKCLLLFLFFLYHSAHAQKSNLVWCFGDSAGINFSNLSNPQPIFTGIDTRGSCVSIADSGGILIFDGKTGRNGGGSFTGQVHDSTNNLMLNGDSIIGDAWYHELIIIPHPNQKSSFYLFATDVTMHQILNYSIIDMNGNGGLGAITTKNLVIDNGYYYYDAMAAVKHGNGRDWWMIGKRYNSSGDSVFQIYLITPDSIFHFSQSAGASANGKIANMTFSKKGDKFLFTTYRGLIEVMDFDRCSGLFSNSVIISQENLTTPLYYWGSAFSPNENIVYVSTNADTSYLFQFNLNAPNIFASSDTLATFLYPTYVGGALRLAPDDKIYLSNAFYNGTNFNYPYPDSVRNMYNENLSVINSPDSFGSACNFTAYSFYLGGKRTYWGLPNNPDYDMGPLNGSPCDTINGIKEVELSAKNRITIYPNPVFSEDLTLSYNTLTESATVSIFNIDCKEIARYSLAQRSSEQQLKLPKLASGMYFVVLQSGDRRRTGRFAKE
jgi:hypothetical protein